MPNPIDPDLYRVNLLFSDPAGADAQVALDVLDLNSTGDPSGVFATVTGAWTDTASIGSIQANDTGYMGGIVTPYDGSSAGVPFGPADWPVSQGTGGTPEVPPQIAWVITKQTGLSGRSRRGRIYVPGVARTFLDDPPGRFAPGDAVDLQAAADAFFSGLGSVGFPELALQVVSKKEGDFVNVTALRSNPGYLGTQRRRARH